MLYVLIQFSLLGYMIYNTPWMDSGRISFVFFFLSIILGLWAFKSMGLSSFSVFPDPKTTGKISLSGPYKHVRHPMYTSVILFSIGMIIANPVWQMYLAVIVLIIDLLFKLSYEEKKLLEKFETYREYKKNSWSLLPFIY